MSEFVTDTHALCWHLLGDTRLSPMARRLFLGADTGEHRAFVPTITLIEIVYLAEKGRIDPALVDSVLRLLDNVAGSYIVAPLDLGTARVLRDVPRSLVADMPDRIIVATARQLELPLISRDAAIRRTGLVRAIW